MAVGKFVGGLLFGSISDTYGRKYAFNLAVFIYIFSGPSAALFDSYILFLIARFLIGIAGSGVYESSYTICNLKLFLYIYFITNKFNINNLI